MKKVFALLLSLMVVTAVSMLGVQIFEGFHELKKVNVRVVQLDRAMQSFSQLATRKNYEYTESELKSLESNVKQLTGGIVTGFDMGVVKNYQSYMAGRGNAKAVQVKSQHFATLVQELITEFQQEGYKSLKEALQIKTIWTNTNVAQLTTVSPEINELLSILHARFSKVSMDEVKRQRALDGLTQQQSLLKEIIARLDYKNKNLATIEKMGTMIVRVLTSLADNQSILQAHTRLLEHQLYDYAKYSASICLLLALTFSIVQLRSVRVITKETVKEVEIEKAPSQQILFNQYLNSMLQSQLDSATVILNHQDQIIWASHSFFEMAGSLDKNKSYNWNDLLKSEIIMTGGVHHIKGAVKIKSRPAENFIMTSRTMPVAAGMLRETRLIQFTSLLNYQSELNRELTKFDSVKTVERPKLFELGDIVEEAAKKMHLRFTKNKIIFSECNPIFVAVDRLKFGQSIETILTGVLLYGENTFGSANVSVGWDREGDVNTLVLAFDKTKFENVTAPMIYKGKTYPSFSAYLAKLEDQLAPYRGEIQLKNIYQKAGHIQEGRLEIRFKEYQLLIQDAANLNQRERVARAVQVARKSTVVRPATESFIKDSRFAMKEFN